MASFSDNPGYRRNLIRHKNAGVARNSFRGPPWIARCFPTDTGVEALENLEDGKYGCDFAYASSAKACSKLAGRGAWLSR